MATITQPPFWVPRGDQQDTVWYAQPLKSPIIPFLTQQKIFGAGGQVPTKRWLPYLTYDDPPMWQGAPLNSGAIQVTKTQVKFFGQPGQAPTKNWVPYLLYDDPPMWQGSPLNSGAIMATKTQVKFYGQPGQAPTKTWARWLTYDDPSVWAPWPTDNSAIIQLLTAQHFFGAGGQAPTFRPNLTYDDPPVWQATVERNLSLLFPTQNPFSNRQGQWSDDASYWSGKPVNAAIIQILTANAFYGQGGQVPPFRPNFTLDDPPMWQGAPRAAISLNIPGIRFYGQIGQVPPFRPNFTYDDASYWSGKPINSALLQQLLTAPVVYGQGGQAAPFRWNYTYDDPGFWTGEPLNSAAIPLLTQQKVFGQGGQVPPYRWNHTLDDPPSWSPTVERNLSLLFPAQNPFSNRQWQWSDDASYWSGEPVSSAAIPLLTQQKIFGVGGQVPPYRWNYTLDDPPPWQWPLYERNPNVLIPSAEPFNNYKTYWYSEDSFWQGSPRNSGAITATRTQVTIYGQPGQAPPFRPNFTYDDAPTWQWTMAERNPNVLQPLSQPFSNRQLIAYDDPAVWQGTPTWSATITLSGFHLYAPRSSLYFWRTYLDDWSTWQWPLYERNPNVLQPSGEPFNNYKNFWYSEDAWWQGAPLNSNTMRLPALAPFSNRQTYWYSEDAWWNAKPVSSAAIPLLTQQTIYGQGGQVPPFRPNFTIDDPPMWPGPVPRGSAVIQLPKTTTFFGQAGQVPTKCWAQYYTIDVPPMWQGTPVSFNYLLTQPQPPAKPAGNDWIDFRRRARRR